MNSASAPAPEQLLGKPVDTYTDVYALGAALYRMLTGHRVFRGKSRSEIVQQHLNAPVPSVRTWRSDLPEGIDTIIAKAMAKEPAQRYQQPGAFANAYHQIVAPNDTRRKPFVIASNVPQTFSPALPKRVEPIAMRPLTTERRDGQTRISRRRALTLLGAGGGAAAAIVAVAFFGSRYLVGSTSPTSSATVPNTNSTGSSSTSSGTTAPGHTGRVLARTSDVSVNSAKQFAIANSNNPGLLIHLPDNRFVAFDSTCTHAGCPVSYNPSNKLLECPCHGAVFDPAKNAAVVGGPAPSPLTKINIAVNSDGTITTG
jgi:Rieske Fe-S protein